MNNIACLAQFNQNNFVIWWIISCLPLSGTIQSLQRFWMNNIACLVQFNQINVVIWWITLHACVTDVKYYSPNDNFVLIELNQTPVYNIPPILVEYQLKVWSNSLITSATDTAVLRYLVMPRPSPSRLSLPAAVFWAHYSHFTVHTAPSVGRVVVSHHGPIFSVSALGGRGDLWPRQLGGW